MDWNTLRQRWQSAAETIQAPADVEALRERDRQLRATVKRRDRLETAVALLVAPLFVWVAWDSAAEGHLLRAGFALFIALWGGFVPLRLWYSRRQMPTLHADRPLLEYLGEEREAMLAQARMLESIWIWYLAPCAIGVLGLVLSVRAPTLGTWIYIAVVLGFCALIGKANKVAARTRFRALAEDIGRQLQVLNKENGV
ncbi:hypothetical protein [Pseudomarimonas arenosa]|uniref:Uncharacterized protein n=1 Tax=Pseudomarimonas arenosa TaxID=2774145 RepID=A0AAW3ZLY9_9GAMM|nr:hypothetical protein [Pseudomarimonas arenosa]MBD8527145.1 hypothetical protein [Pseudomarimonas arenosa]